MRNFLNEITIVGGMLVSRAGAILHYSIPNLLKWCDWIVLMMDNEDEEVRKIVADYKEEYGDRIRIAHSGLDRAKEEQEGAKLRDVKEKGGLFRRYRALQGVLKEKIFEYLRECLKNGEKVDILIMPDCDEIFSDHLPETLEKFWAAKDKRAIAFKPVDVFNDMRIIKKHSMAPHVRVLKFAPDFRAVPRKALSNFYPLTKKDRMGRVYLMIHLYALLPEVRKWRSEHWKTTRHPEHLLWKLDKDVRRMTQKEIREVFKTEPYMTLGEYLKKEKLEI